MLKLKPLIDRLVDDVLRAIGDATLAELGGAERAPAAPRSAQRSRRRPKRRRAAPSARPHAAPATHASAEDVFDPTEVDAITRPEELLGTTTAPAEPVLTPRKPAGSSGPEDAVPPSQAQPVAPRTHKLRAGESVVRATAAGVVIRRARNR